MNGSFSCSCSSGFLLNPDGTTCDGESEILYKIFPCTSFNALYYEVMETQLLVCFTLHFYNVLATLVVVYHCNITIVFHLKNEKTF